MPQLTISLPHGLGTKAAANKLNAAQSPLALKQCTVRLEGDVVRKRLGVTITIPMRMTLTITDGNVQADVEYEKPWVVPADFVEVAIKSELSQMLQG